VDRQNEFHVRLNTAFPKKLIGFEAVQEELKQLQMNSP
jgi:hypothetical protein